MTDEILKRIDALAAKFGVTADHLWGVLVREARIEAIEDIAWAVLWLVLCGALAKFSVVLSKKDDVFMPPSLLCAVGACLASFVALAYISGTPGMFLNPEYWALQQIMKAVKP